MNVDRYAKRSFCTDPYSESDENCSKKRSKVQDDPSNTEIVPLEKQLSADDPWIAHVHEQAEAKTILEHFYATTLKARTCCYELLRQYPVLSNTPLFFTEITHINSCSNYYLLLRAEWLEAHFSTIFACQETISRAEYYLDRLELRAGPIISLLEHPTSQTDPAGAALPA